MPTLAPEVGVTERHSYENRIDIWSLEYVCCQILLPSAQLDQETRLDRVKHNIFLPKFSEYAKQLHRADSTDVRVSASKRLSATEALHHPRFQERADDTSTSSSDPQVYVSYSSKRQRNDESEHFCNTVNNKVEDKRLVESHSGDTEPLSFDGRSLRRESADGAGWRTFRQ